MAQSRLCGAGGSRLCEQIDFFQLFMYSRFILGIVYTADIDEERCSASTTELKKKYVVCLLLEYIRGWERIARLGHQFCIMKHDVDEIKVSLLRWQFIFNNRSPPPLCVIFYSG